VKKSIWLWIIAYILTVFTTAFQRITGPIYPVNGEVILSGETIKYKLDRTHRGEGDYLVVISAAGESICGEL